MNDKQAKMVVAYYLKENELPQEVKEAWHQICKVIDKKYPETISDIYFKIQEKRNEMQSDYLKEARTSRTPKDTELLTILPIKIDDYTDILKLIEDSEVLK